MGSVAIVSIGKLVIRYASFVNASNLKRCEYLIERHDFSAEFESSGTRWNVSKAYYFHLKTLKL